MAAVYAPVDRLVEILGVQLALKFVERFGGRRLYVPQPERLKSEGAIVATIGFEAAHKLAFEWRGLDIMVPMCAQQLREARDRAIRAEPESMSVRDIAAKYGTTERHVFRILATPAPAEPAGQPSASAQRDFFLKT